MIEVNLPYGAIVSSAELAVDRNVGSTAIGDHDTRGADRDARLGAFDHLAAHDEACVAFLLVSGQPWLSDGRLSDVDFPNLRIASLPQQAYLADGNLAHSQQRSVFLPPGLMSKRVVVIEKARYLEKAPRYMVGGPGYLSGKTSTRAGLTIFDRNTGSYVRDPIEVAGLSFPRMPDAARSSVLRHNKAAIAESAANQPHTIWRLPKLVSMSANAVFLNEHMQRRAGYSAARKRADIAVLSVPRRGTICGGLEMHFLGACGENAVALGIPKFRFMSRPIGTYDQPDFMFGSLRIFVDTRDKPSRDLMVQKEAAVQDRWHLLVVRVTDVRYKIVGLLNGADVRRSAALTAKENGWEKKANPDGTYDPTGNNRRPAYFVKQKFLIDVRDFIDRPNYAAVGGAG